MKRSLVILFLLCWRGFVIRDLDVNMDARIGTDYKSAPAKVPAKAPAN